MEPKNKTTLESIDLLQNRIHAPLQAFASDVKYPCTGFCYMVAQNRHLLIDLYNDKSSEYYNFILNLLKLASDRKKNNPNIDIKGEYINCETTKQDFPEIYKSMTFTEVGSPDEESFAIAQNNLYMLLLDTSDYMMVTRSDETFIMLRIDFELVLVVDSHQAFHGTLSLEKATHYILKNGTYRGLSQIGYT